MAKKTLDSSLVHGTKAVHLQEAALFVFDQHHFRNHETQTRKRLHHLIGRFGIGCIEAIEREHDRGQSNLTLQNMIKVFARCDRDTTAKP